MDTMKARVTSRKEAGKQRWEATASICGLRPTKLQKTDGSSSFATKSAATQAIHALARKLNFTVALESDQKKAAKKSVRNRCSGR